MSAVHHTYIYAKMAQLSLDTIREIVMGRLSDYLTYYEGNMHKSEHGWPNWPQSIRIRALQHNKRILVADDTGVNGKTFTAIAGKIAAEREFGERLPALVIATNDGMANAWSEDEIQRYAGYMRSPNQRVLIVHDFKNLANAKPDLDFIVINWEKLSTTQDSRQWGYFDQMLRDSNRQFFVLDECHNAKSPRSLRGKTMLRISPYTVGKYLMLLSATPIPNRYKDLAMVFHLLDPIRHPSVDTFSYSPPEEMEELLGRQVWFRLTRQDLKQELGLPEFREEVVDVKLSRQEAEIYFRAWADCVTLGRGLSELRKVLYNAQLSSYAQGEVQSSKMAAAAKLTDYLISSGQKVSIKVNYVNGVVDKLADLLSQKHNVVAVDGRVASTQERKERYERFRFNPNYNILVTSPVGEESIDLTTRDVPCSLIAFEPQLTPREFAQWTGRVYRRGQMADVTHYTLVGVSSELESMMGDFVKRLEAEYDIKAPKKFTPRTIDADMLAIRHAKQRVTDKIYAGTNISAPEESLHDANDPDRAFSHMVSLLAPRSFSSMSPFELATLVQTKWRNLGENNFGRLVKTDSWTKWKSMYERNWERSASYETNAHLGGIIEMEFNGSGPRIVVIGDGAAYFSRATGRSVISTDIDANFQQAGKKICGHLGIENRYIAARATQIPLPGGFANVVVNAYAIFYLGQDSDRNEVERSVIETNRVMTDDGLLLIALPYTIEPKVITRFTRNMPEYGFEPSLYHSPRETRKPNMKNGCHVLGFRKTSSVESLAGLNLSFYDGKVRFLQ